MQQLKKILVAYDGSAHSKKALNWVIDFSLLSGAEVLVVKVFEASGIYETSSEPGASFLMALEEMLREDKRMLDEAVAVGKNRGVSVKGEIIEGDVARELLSYAEQHHVDMIAIGVQGRGQLEELLIGSVTRKLVSLAHVPVVVVKD